MTDDAEIVLRLEAELEATKAELQAARAESKASIAALEHANTRCDELVSELQHRVKNVLATISSLAMRMIRGSESIEDFSAAFLGRLIAMGAMHEMLSARGWVGADLRTLVKATISPYCDGGDDRHRIGGPSILLKPNAAATLGMVFHELTTNAAKYGALSVPKGRLELTWAIENSTIGPRLSLTWSEYDGPPVSPPDHEGFGSVFVQRSVEFELEGTAVFDFKPSGVRCAIRFPFRHNIESFEPGGRVQ